MFTIGGTSNRGFYPFEPTGSLRFEDGDTAFLAMTPASTGNRRKYTISVWVKRGNLSSYQNIFDAYDGSSTNQGMLRFQNTDELVFRDGGSSSSGIYTTSAKFRDPSAWYHIVAEVDTTLSTAADRVKIYVNGESQTFGSQTNTQQNNDGQFNYSSAELRIGLNSGSAQIFDGYMAEIYLVDGTAHDADAFGEFKNGVWMPKDAKGSLTFGTNGFYLPFNSTVVSEGQSTVLYEGVGGTQTIQGMGYKPDLLWVKRRTGGTAEHGLHDRLRGPSGIIGSDNTNAEIQRQYVTAFHDDGFSLASNVSNYNYSGSEYVAWAWDAGADQTPTGFGCVTYTGSGTRRPVRDIGFKPDLVWLKSRESAKNHLLNDSVRGPSKNLFSNLTNAEGTSSSGSGIQSFDDDGFTIGSDSDNAGINNSGDDMVAWCWDAGDGDAVSNTDGDITSTVKASDTHGFSIVKYTGSGTDGDTVGHGLSTAPDWIVIKQTDGTQQWCVFHSSASATAGAYLLLNKTDAVATDGSVFNNTDPTSSVFTVTDANGDTNRSGDDYIAYCWTEKSGYSKFGSYTGNGSSSGPAITGLGFRPAFLMIKRTDAANNWNIHDTTRDPLGTLDNRLYANLSSAEDTGGSYGADLNSDGFTITTAEAGWNASGGTYIYMAFAGGLDTIAPVNTDGDIDSRVKASDDTGFSIVRYQGSGTAGDSIGHGLSAAPDWIVSRRIDSTANWSVYHSSMDSTAPEDYYMQLNGTIAATDAVGAWHDTAPTSSVFTVGSFGDQNTSGADHIAYCWTATTGKSAFGSYTGNASASGPEVTGLGFRPALVILKNTDDTTNWYTYDDKRGGLEDNDEVLLPNSSLAESSNFGVDIDLNDDGFQVVTSSSRINGNNNEVIYMAFADGRDASFFHDESGQGNHFEPENVQNYDVVPDSPTNNFATMNPVDKNNGSYAEGNLKATTGTVGGSTQRASYYVSSGKWYYEFQPTSNGGITAVGFESLSGGSYSSHMYQADNGQYYNGSSASSYGATYGNSDIIGIALDADNQTVEFFKNGVSQGELSSSNSGMTAGDEYVPFLSDRNVSQTMTGIFNFGQDDSFAGTVTPGGYTDENERGSFKYPVPSGFLSLCTQNLPDPAIDPAAGDEPENYIDTQLWTGTGSGQTFSNWSFQPDFLWFKHRNGSSDHALFDVIRGVNKGLKSNANAAERTSTASQDLVSFDSDGFTTGTPQNFGSLGSNTHTIATWGWKAGGTAASNTDGTVTSSVSANTKAGFSIVSWDGDGASAGATVGHGLDSAPELILPKNRGASGNWHSYHSALGATKGILLNSTNAASTDSGFWNNTEPTSSVFTVGTYNVFNNDYIAYCFHSVPGYSKVGSYTGNGSSDGAYVHCGFKPAWIMIKSTGVNNWVIYDNKRSPTNVSTGFISADSNSAEQTNTFYKIDFLSNGFKPRVNDGLFNSSGQEYVFLAFAEMPFKYSTGR